MLSELKFVQGSVAKKDFLPALTHFVIENNTVRGYNGTLALCSPIPFDISCKPKAEPLVRAIGNCNETVQLSLTATGKLSVRSGKFRVSIECMDGETPHVQPTGTRIDYDGGVLKSALKKVQPFIGDDAARPWSNGVLLRGPSIFATNNITLVEYWTGQPFPVVVNIPRMAVKELLRIEGAPVAIQYDDSSVTFHYENGQWLRTQLLPSDSWPDLGRVLDAQSNAIPVDPRLFEGLATLKPFVDKLGRVLFKGGVMTTHDTDGEGAAYALEGLPDVGIYNVDMLCLLDGVAETADFAAYPKPCLFYGQNLRGAVIGMRA